MCVCGACVCVTAGAQCLQVALPGAAFQRGIVSAFPFRRARKPSRAVQPRSGRGPCSRAGGTGPGQKKSGSVVGRHLFPENRARVENFVIDFPFFSCIVMAKSRAGSKRTRKDADAEEEEDVQETQPFVAPHNSAALDQVGASFARLTPFTPHLKCPLLSLRRPLRR